jgi:hypothetical protein
VKLIDEAGLEEVAQHGGPPTMRTSLPSAAARARSSAAYGIVLSSWLRGALAGTPAGMTRIGLVGSGHIGSTGAKLAVDAGHQVVRGNSRGPETLAGLVAEPGPQARAATSEEASAEGGIVVVAVPVKAYPRLPAAPLAGKVVIDKGNYMPGEVDAAARCGLSGGSPPDTGDGHNHP